MNYILGVNYVGCELYLNKVLFFFFFNIFNGLLLLLENSPESFSWLLGSSLSCLDVFP